MKKILGAFLAVAIMLTGILGNVNIVQAANAGTAELCTNPGYAVVDSAIDSGNPSFVNYLDFDPDNPNQEIVLEIYTETTSLTENTSQNFKCQIESTNPDVLEIVGSDTFEWEINKDSYNDGYSYCVFASIKVEVYQPGAVNFRVTDLNNNISTEKAFFSVGLTVTQPGFLQTEINLNGNEPQELEVYDENILKASAYHYFCSLNSNVAEVSQKIGSTSNPVLTVTPVANGTTYIIGGSDLIGFMVCKVNVTGMEEAAELEWQDYTEPQGDVKYKVLVTGYDMETLGGVDFCESGQTYFNGYYLNRFKNRVDADNMKFSISRTAYTSLSPLTSIKELLEKDSYIEGKLFLQETVVQAGEKYGDVPVFGLDTTAFPYIKIYKKPESMPAGGIYEDLDLFMCGEEVASFAKENMYYDEPSGQICVKEGTLQDDEKYVLVIDPKFQMWTKPVQDGMDYSQSVNYYLYFDFTTKTKEECFADNVSELKEFAYTQEYAELLQNVSSEYASLSPEEQEACAEDYNTYTGYQAVYDLYTAIENLDVSNVTTDSREEIRAARKAYNVLSSSMKALVDDETYAKLVEAEDTYETASRIQKITVKNSSLNMNYSPSAFALGASTDGNGKLSYTSSDTGVATVDQNGNVTMKGIGTTTITIKAAQTAQFDAAEAKVTLTVAKGTQSITVNPGSVAATFKLNASGTGNGAFTYASSNVSIASVNSSGVVTVNNAGTVTFTITAAESALYKSAVKTVTMDITAVQGKTYTVGNLKYKVTSAKTNGSGTVTVTGVTTKKATVTIGKTVTIGNHSYKITAVGASAFKNDKKLTSVSVGANVTTIGANAFYGCTKLKKATLGKGVTSIGSKAFYGDKLLAKLTITSSALKKVGTKAFKGIKSTAVIDVPNKKVTAYKKLMKGKGQGSKVKIK